MSNVRNLKARLGQDWEFGLFCIVFGLAVLVLSRNYTFGAASRMGPGFFPTLIGWLIVANGAVLVFLRGSAESGRSAPPADLRLISGIVGSVLFFGFTLERLGLVVAVGGMVAICSLGARHDGRVAETLGLAGAIVGFVLVVFVLVLDLPLKVLPA